MASSNQSPEYLEERERARRWLLHTKDGQLARTHLMANAPHGDAAGILDDDNFVLWDDIVQEYRGATILASNCAEARKAFDVARQSHSAFGPPNPTKAKWGLMAQFPLGYHLRRTIETMDPDYWADETNFLRECLDNPQWLHVPVDMIRGLLEARLPKSQRKELPNLIVPVPQELPTFTEEITT